MCGGYGAKPPTDGSMKQMGMFCSSLCPDPQMICVLARVQGPGPGLRVLHLRPAGYGRPNLPLSDPRYHAIMTQLQPWPRQFPVAVPSRSARYPRTHRRTDSEVCTPYQCQLLPYYVLYQMTGRPHAPQSDWIRRRPSTTSRAIPRAQTKKKTGPCSLS